MSADAAVGIADVSTMLVSLIAVVGLIVAGGYVLRRTPLGAASRQSGPLRIIASLPLGPKERLLLVDARGTELLLAVSPAGVFNVGAGGGDSTAAARAAGEGARRRVERAEPSFGGQA